MLELEPGFAQSADFGILFEADYGTEGCLYLIELSQVLASLILVIPCCGENVSGGLQSLSHVNHQAFQWFLFVLDIMNESTMNKWIDETVDEMIDAMNE